MALFRQNIFKDGWETLFSTLVLDNPKPKNVMLEKNTVSYIDYIIWSLK